MTEWDTFTGQSLAAIRAEKPLIHNITNFVVMNSTANTILAVGASPVMAHAIDEVEEMVCYAKALVLNIGTLDHDWIAAMIKAGKKANQLSIPVILDPVGAGATGLRTRAATSIIEEVKISVLRGNASEVKAVAGSSTNIRGVDSLEDSAAVVELAGDLATDLRAVVAITGAVDYITDGNEIYSCHNGHEMFSRVTGTGCAATTVIGCFCAINSDLLKASVSSLAYFGLAGEMAAEKSKGPGSFQVALYDSLANLDVEKLKGRLKIKSMR